MRREIVCIEVTASLAIKVARIFLPTAPVQPKTATEDMMMKFEGSDNIECLDTDAGATEHKREAVWRK